MTTATTSGTDPVTTAPTEPATRPRFTVGRALA